MTSQKYSMIQKTFPHKLVIFQALWKESKLCPHPPFPFLQCSLTSKLSSEGSTDWKKNTFELFFFFFLD